MRARELAAKSFPTVTLDTPALTAARLMAKHDLPGLLVTTPEGKPCTVVAGSQVMRMAVPRYIQDDPALAGVVDEETADLLAAGLDGRTVRELLSEEKRELAIVDCDATVLEVGALMARLRSPLVAVVDADGLLVGAITVDSLLDRLLGE